MDLPIMWILQYIKVLVVIYIYKKELHPVAAHGFPHLLLLLVKDRRVFKGNRGHKVFRVKPEAMVFRAYKVFKA